MFGALTGCEAGPVKCATGRRSFRGATRDLQSPLHPTIGDSRLRNYEGDVRRLTSAGAAVLVARFYAPWAGLFSAPSSRVGRLRHHQVYTDAE